MGKIEKISLCLLIMYFLSTSSSTAQQLIPDGLTNTQINSNRNITNVNTQTIKGVNAFNSFKKFNIAENNTVNLHLPGGTNNLINLVHSEASYINGTLNSLKNNQIGGNLFFVNPYGITVGKQGSINVGSLTAVTPTVDFMNNFFRSPGSPDSFHVNAILSNSAPVNPEGIINIQGQIKAIESVRLDTGNLINSGKISIEPDQTTYLPEIQDIVNTEDLNNEEHLAIQNGQIVINSINNVINSGVIASNGIDNKSAGNIEITAKNNIKLENNSVVCASGAGKNSSGGSIYIFADNESTLEKGALIDASAGKISGNGGSLELSAKNKVEIKGKMAARGYNGNNGNILIDPLVLEFFDNQFSDGADLTLSADESITLHENVIISTRNLADVNAEDHSSAPSMGNSGFLHLESPIINFNANSKVYTFADNGFNSGELRLVADNVNIDPNGCLLDASGATAIISRKTDGKYAVSNVEPSSYYSWVKLDSLNQILADNLHIGNHEHTNNMTKQIYVNKEGTINHNLTLSSYDRTNFDFNSVITINGDLTVSGEGEYHPFSDAIFSTFSTLNVNGKLKAEGNKVQIYRGSNITANSVDIMGEYYLKIDNSNLISNTDINLKAETLLIDTISETYNSSIEAPNGKIVVSKLIPGDFYVGDYGVLNTHSFSRFNSPDVILGNHEDTNSLTKSIYISNDIIASNPMNITLNANDNIYCGRSRIETTGNINLNAINGNIGEITHYVNINEEGENSQITAIAGNKIHLNETSGHMNINTIQSTGNSDIYLSNEDFNGGFLNTAGENHTNISGGNLFIKKPDLRQNYYYIGIAGDATADNRGNSLTFFLDTMKEYGENWSEMSPDNSVVFDDTVSDFTKTDVLGRLEFFASKMRDNDLMFITYNGHGGSRADSSPKDETNGIALNTDDEYMSLNGFSLYDDEFADALKQSKGTVVFATGQCMGGMFGGDADLDSVANNNNFKYYGISGNQEGYLAFSRGYYRYEQNFKISDVEYSMLDSLTEENPIFIFWEEDAEAPQDIHYVNYDHAQNADGNVYINEWFDAIKKEDTYWIFYDNNTYPEVFSNYTNMDGVDLAMNPVILQTWDETINYTPVNSIGEENNTLNININGSLEAIAQNNIHISGNVTGNIDTTSSDSNITFEGIVEGKIQASSPNGSINIIQNDSNLTLGDLSAGNSVNLNTLNGNLINENGIISASAINISALNGAAGTSDNELLFLIQNGSLNVTAGGNIYGIASYSGNTLSLKSINGRAYIVSNRDLLNMAQAELDHPAAEPSIPIHALPPGPAEIKAYSLINLPQLHENTDLINNKPDYKSETNPVMVHTNLIISETQKFIPETLNFEVKKPDSMKENEDRKENDIK